MINLSFEKVISISKKYASMNDEPWHRVEFLTQIVSDVIRAQGTPTQFTFKSSTLNGKEIAEICKEIFKDLGITVKIKLKGKTRAVFLVI